MRGNVCPLPVNVNVIQLHSILRMARIPGNVNEYAPRVRRKEDGMFRPAAVLAVGLLLSVPALLRAQDASSGTIAGVVRDQGGAVLPGVTVEASSPALIERTRSVVTDGEGRYRLVDLRSGSYTVVFSLQGFRTMRREGIDLTTGFVATVNADLGVGEIAETITVTGRGPTR